VPPSPPPPHFYKPFLMYLSSPKTFPLLFIVFLILLPTSPFFLPPPPSHPLTIPLHASRLRSALIFRWLRTNNGTDTAPLQSLPAPTLEDLATSAQESTALIRKKEPKPRRLKSKVTVTSPAALRRSLYSDPAAPLLLSDHIYSEPSYSPSVLRSLVARNPVLQLVRDRAVAGSVPGQRQAHDHAHLALSIEGGGMRGCVSSGIAAAIALLDLLPAFDSIHGASAGSIVGAYAVSQQMCVDVYTGTCKRDTRSAMGEQFTSACDGLKTCSLRACWAERPVQRVYGRLVAGYERPSGPTRAVSGPKGA